MSETSEDAELLRRWREGDTSAYDILYRKYYSLVCSIAWKAFHNSATADDVAQSVMLTVWKTGLTHYTPRSTFKAWISTITYNRTLDIIRSRAVRPESYTTTEQLNWIEDHYELESSCLARIIVEQILPKLPNKLREVITLVLLRGYTTLEVAELLGVPRNTVKSRVRYGKKFLRDMFPTMSY